MTTNKRTKRIITGIVIAQLVLVIGLLALPTAVQAIPGRYRVALSERIPFASTMLEGVIDQVAPVDENLPVAQTNASTNVDISALINSAPPADGASAPLDTTITQPSPTPHAEPSPTLAPPTPTVEVAQVEEEAVTAVATTPPTATPLPPTPTAQPTLPPPPASVIHEGVERITQTFNNCGPANLTQVLNYYDYDITQKDIGDYLKPNIEDRNVSPWQIEDYVNEFTPYTAIARSNGTMDMLKQFIANDILVVIEKGYEIPESGWWGHYLTVFGYDDETELIYSQDSYLPPSTEIGRTDPYDEFELFWSQFNYTFYVVYQPAQEELVYQILGADMVDDFTMWQLTAERAEKQTTDDPENAFAWFNLGTALTRMGELTGEQQYYQGGAQAFDQARAIGLPNRMLWYQFRIYTAYQKVGRYQDVIDLADATLATQGGRNVEETYWYKGHALLALANYTGAKEAYETALERNENFYAAEWSLNYVDSLLNGG